MTPQEIIEAMETAEADRLCTTIELRNALVRAAQELLPTAIQQAKPTKYKRGKLTVTRPGSPALLRLIARIAMRPVRLDRPAENPWQPDQPVNQNT